MKQIKDLIQEWYGRNEDRISFDNRFFYLIELFQDLKMLGVSKELLPDVGSYLISLLSFDLADESIARINCRMIAGEITSAFKVVNKDIAEIKDTPIQIQAVVEIDDNDIYTNNTGEPDIDLRGIEWEQIPDDIAFLKELGVDSE